jgi:putative Mn2+ efflux pump MntP
METNLTNLTTVLLIATSLAMDSLAVSLAKGSLINKSKTENAIKAGLYFGFFQFIMPLIGWYLGVKLLTIVSQIDHWIAFSILAAIGLKMIYDSFHNPTENKNFKTKTMIILAVATSIDALIVGISFAFLKYPIWQLAISAGLITFLLSFVGVIVGVRLKRLLGNKVKIIGGLILVLIGLKILINHLFV